MGLIVSPAKSPSHRNFTGPEKPQRAMRTPIPVVAPELTTTSGEAASRSDGAEWEAGEFTGTARLYRQHHRFAAPDGDHNGRQADDDSLAHHSLSKADGAGV